MASCTLHRARVHYPFDAIGGGIVTGSLGSLLFRFPGVKPLNQAAVLSTMFAVAAMGFHA